MAENELDLIPDIRTANWNQRGSVHIGKCAGWPAFWSCEDGKLSILIGRDDESWGFAVMMPEAVIDNMITEIETAREQLSQK